MTDVLQEHIDIILMFHSIAVAFLAAVFYGHMRLGDSKVPWNWALAFALFHLAYQCLCLVSVSSPSNDVFNYLQLVFLGISFSCLMEMGRIYLVSYFGRGPSRWWSLVWTLGALSFGLLSIQALNHSVHFMLRTVALIMAGFSLYFFARTETKATHSIRLTAYLTWIYAVVAACLPHTDFPPNKPWFHLGASFIVLLIAGGTEYFRLALLGKAETTIIRSIRKGERLYFAMGLAVLVCGIVAAIYNGKGRFNDIRENLLRSTHVMASVVTADDLSSLSGGPSDYKHPTYLRLHSMLKRMLDSQFETHYVYALRRSENKLYFVFDIMPERAPKPGPGEAMIGEEYDEWTPEFFRVFDHGNDFFEGPVADKFGTWFSAHVAIRDPRTHKVMAVVGQDVMANQFLLSVFRSRLSPLLATMLFLILILTAWVVWKRGREQQVLDGIRAERLLNFQKEIVRLYHFILDLDLLIRRSTQIISDTTGALRASVWIREEGNTFRCQGGIPANLVLEGRTMCLTSVHDLASFRARDCAPVEWEGAIAGTYGVEAPIRSGREVLGVLMCEWSSTPMTELELFETKEFIASVADVLSIALEHHYFMRAESEKRNIESQLIHSAKLATIGVMTAGVVHEINNPLMAVGVNLEIMSQELPPEFADYPVFKDFYQKQLKYLNRIETIVRGLRNYSRVDSDVLRLVDVHASIGDLLDLVQAMYHKVGIEIQIDLQSQGHYIIGDDGKLQQVIMNLLSNGRDAILSVRESGTIRITTTDDGDSLLIRVCDDGQGISDSVRQKLFEPFFTTKPPGKGTGLGLHLINKMVTAMKGEVQVESEFGKGTCFQLSFPVAKRNQDQVAS